VIPFAPGLFGQDLNIGLLYFFAVGGLSVVGLLMAGWSSFNKYSLLAGLILFMLKTFLLVFVFVWMRGTLPRVRIDQLMNFAWKWLLPASLLNLFATAGAIVVATSVRGS